MFHNFKIKVIVAKEVRDIRLRPIMRDIYCVRYSDKNCIFDRKNLINIIKKKF